MKRILLTLFLFAASAAQAQSVWTGYFTIMHLYIAEPANYFVRVVGMPPTPGCVAGTPWAYINQAQAGSNVYISGLMLAYASGKQVNLFVGPDAQGYCSIVEVQY